MSETKKIDCKYWEKCYQKNPAHHAKYNHPSNIQSSPLTEEANDKKMKLKRSPSPYLDVGVSKKHKLSSASKFPLSEEQMSSNPRSGSEYDLKESQSSRTSKHHQKSPKTNEMEHKKPAEKKQTSPNLRQKSDDEKCTTSPGASIEKDDKNDRNNETTSDSFEDLKNEVMNNLSDKNYFEIFQKRVRYSQKAEYQDLLKTPEFIRHKFLVEMPSDFYKFWDFCIQLSENDKIKNKSLPQKQFEKFGLYLVGPFDYLSGNFNDAKICEPGDYLCHWRFYYDPPEFQTIFMKNKTCIHYGYWRDNPKDSENLLMAKNDADKGCEFEFVGGNCFETVLYYLDKDCPCTPFNRKQITDMKNSIEQYAIENNIPLKSLDKLKKERDKEVVCKTFHKAGLVVPFNRKTEVGYRGLIENDTNIKKILSKLEKADKNREIIENVLEALQPIITGANIAVDECDFGTSIELGIDLFSSGYKELHDVIRSLLIPGYSMLQRPQFIAIMKAHLEDRRKGYNLSIFE